MTPVEAMQHVEDEVVATYPLGVLVDRLAEPAGEHARAQPAEG
jgi:hypothetical protein